MMPAAGFFLAMGVAGVVYGGIGRLVAKSPPTGYSAGAGRARALVKMTPILLRVGWAALALGVVLLVVGLATQ